MSPSRDPEDNARKRLLRHVSRDDYQPLKRDKLLRQMRVKTSDRPFYLEVLGGMLRDGVLVDLKQKGVTLAESVDLVKGRINFTRSGAAVVTESHGSREVWVLARDTGTAMHGDHVLVRINRPAPTTGNRLAEGAVLRVLDRARSTVVGVLKRSKVVWFVQPLKATISQDVIVPGPGDAKEGDRVLVELAPWEDPHINPEGEIVEVIGPADDPSLDTLAVLRSNELSVEFPPDVVAEAEAANMHTDREINEGRADLRKLFVFTVDPVTARDYDDGLSLEKRGNNWRLGVHIADVSHFVRPGSALDAEARERGTSVYLPDQVVPMLPEHLSNGLCSLQPNRDRFAFSVFMTVTPEGELLHANFRKSVIHSQVRLTYEQAMEIIAQPEDEGYASAEMNKTQVRTLRRVEELAQCLRARRRRAGALFLDLPDVRFDIGEDGRIADIRQVVNDRSHQMIEECMLLANEAVCLHMARKGVPLLRRIHEPPAPERLEGLHAYLEAAGIETGNLEDQQQMAALIERVAKLPQSHAYFVQILRSLSRAAYDTRPVGHYGLAKTHYTHFTSPIRRYPDLLVHRGLHALLEGRQPPVKNAELSNLGRHCSERETVAMEAEREVRDLKTMRFFREQLESGELREYEAIVTEVRNFGVFIDLPAIGAGGLIHISKLSEDFFDFDPGRLILKGRQTGAELRVGMRLPVVIAVVRENERQLDFVPVELPGDKGGRQKAGGGGASRSGKGRRGRGRGRGGRGGGRK